MLQKSTDIRASRGECSWRQHSRDGVSESFLTDLERQPHERVVKSATGETGALHDDAAEAGVVIVDWRSQVFLGRRLRLGGLHGDV